MRTGVRIAGFGKFGHAEDDQFAAFEGKNSYSRAHSDKQFLRFKRFVDEIIGAGIQAFHDILRSLAASKQNDVNVTVELLGADLPAHFSSRYLRHFPVGNHEPIQPGVNEFHGLHSVARRGDFVSKLQQGILQYFRGEIVVFHNKYSHGIVL